MNLQRKIIKAKRRIREARMIASAMKSTSHPILVHLIPVRRCNLSCTYCNEFDNISSPVFTADVIRRIELLAGLGTSCVNLSGGEPMLHPDLEKIIEAIRARNMLAGLLTNGYLLTPQRIEALNRAGLDHLQISVDNIQPDDVSKKSLKVLDQKLQWLAKYADFDVNINSVLGCGVRNPQDARLIADRALGLGLTSTVGILHDGEGQLKPLRKEHRDVYEQLIGLKKSAFWITGYNRFQENIVRGLPNQWHCTAGSRYLYVCEDGLVHYCSQQRGFPGIPLEKYSKDHLEQEFRSVKSCAPYCTVSCVHRVAMLDQLRAKPVETLNEWIAKGEKDARLPAPVRMLTWMFVESRGSRYFRKAASRLLIERKTAKRQQWPRRP